MSKLPIAAFAALAILAAVMAFPFVLPADANGDAWSADTVAASGYRTCFMERRLVVSGDAPRMEQARRCTTGR